MKSIMFLMTGLLFAFSTASADVRNVFHTADEVFAKVTPLIEEEFDSFIIANTLTSGSDTDLIPFQHARFIVKRSPDLKVFNRNAQGQITGIIENNVTTIEGLPKYIPISSGIAAKKSIRSFSGMFRVNHTKSKDSLSTKKEAGMSYAVYVDAYYTSENRESGAAIHGTPTANHSLLGHSRASHGCMRTYPAYAGLIYNYIIKTDALYADDLIDFNRTVNLPSVLVNKEGEVITRRGTRTLFLIFNGYSQKTKNI